MTFDSVLVANRGEIALRVMSTARRLGLRTVAVYSDADSGARHVREADEAVRLGPAAASASYLSVDAVMAAVRATRAGALHPGYGFLSESPELARRCEEAGVVFVGPPAVVIEQMGRKDEARRLATAAGVPVVPGLTGSHEELARRGAEELGWPLLVKAVAGGGGKAMRVVRRADELGPALEAAEREARSSFGDGSLFLERLVEGGRHIEVQLFADEHRGLVHLFDRDCSVQRRHQKVIEEAPAPGLSEELRKGLWSSALSLGAAIGYLGAGTVEFLVRGEEHFFLEMNTRLQVEHRVTEAICGVDLVEWQLRVAAGDPLPLGQDELVADGHAIEARVYAEDPLSGYLPQAGRVLLAKWPQGVLVDEALTTGDDVTPYYDPMLAKIVASGSSREAARARLLGALEATAVIGIGTNLALLNEVLTSPTFVDGACDTEWLEREGPRGAGPGPELSALAAAWSLARAAAGDSGPFGGDGWRLAGAAAPFRVELASDGAVHSVAVQLTAGSVELAGQTFHVTEAASAAAELTLTIDGAGHTFAVAYDAGAMVVSDRGAVRSFSPAVPTTDELAVRADGEVRAPVPGTLTELNAAVGDRVLGGSPLASIESMKTELVARAPFAGVVTSVSAAVGEHVERGQLLVLVEEEPA